MPDSTRTPGPGFQAKDAPIPPYIVQRATEAYQEGYARGWNDAADKFLKLESSSKDKLVDSLSQESDYRAPEAPPWNDIPGAGHQYADMGETIYKRGYVEGWESSMMSYIRNRRRY
jgi:hypothetical protein